MSEWISVDIGMPETGSLVLTFSGCGILIDCWQWDFTWGCDIEFEQDCYLVTHWMYLPEPPTDG